MAWPSRVLVVSDAVAHALRPPGPKRAPRRAGLWKSGALRTGDNLPNIEVEEMPLEPPTPSPVDYNGDDEGEEMV